MPDTHGIGGAYRYDPITDTVMPDIATPEPEAKPEPVKPEPAPVERAKK